MGYRKSESEVEAAFGYRPQAQGLTSLDENDVQIRLLDVSGFSVCVCVCVLLAVLEYLLVLV